jgi:ribonuclease PH
MASAKPHGTHFRPADARLSVSKSYGPKTPPHCKQISDRAPRRANNEKKPRLAPGLYLTPDIQTTKLINMKTDSVCIGYDGPTPENVQIFRAFPQPGGQLSGMTEFQRPDNRPRAALRPVSFVPDFAPHASGSVLACFGNTRVICAATLEKGVPRWMQSQGVEGGWMSAEYSMLPYSTLDRKPRDIAKGKQDGRSVEIQRLIGRSLRAVADLQRLPGHTLWVDCDVLQADGGTRTAAITGAWVAAEIACQRAIRKGSLEQSPFSDSVAAVSVGILQEMVLLDLCYVEDRDADVDANIVMTGGGRFVETQASGEEATFSHGQLTELLKMAEAGIAELTGYQLAALQAALSD